MTDDAKPLLKRMRRYPWDASTTIEVTLTPDPLGTDRLFVTYEGQDIGHIEPTWGTLDRPISRGSRIVHRGKYRKFWAPGRAHWRKCESQAEAIRVLLSEVQPRD